MAAADGYVAPVQCGGVSCIGRKRAAEAVRWVASRATVQLLARKVSGTELWSSVREVEEDSRRWPTGCCLVGCRVRDAERCPFPCGVAGWTWLRWPHVRWLASRLRTDEGDFQSFQAAYEMNDEPTRSLRLDESSSDVAGFF
jgi:hypothetical protein